MRKRISLLLGMLMVLAALAGCGTADAGEEMTAAAMPTQTVQESVTEASTVDENGFMLDALPELDFGGAQVSVLYDTGVLNQDFFAEGLNGEPVNDALFERNADVEKRLGVSFAFTPEIGNHNDHEKYITRVRSDMSAGAPEFMIYGATSRTLALVGAEGWCYNLLDTKYFDPEKPWWPRALTGEITAHGKMFFCTGDISTNAIWMMSSLIYNDALVKEQHPDTTLYDLVEQGKWTLDKFCEVVSGALVLNGAGTVDTYGLVGYNACFDAFLNANGVISVIKNDEDDFILSEDFLGERTVNIVQKLGTLFTATPTMHQSGTADAERKIFYEGKSLFMVDGIYTVVAGTKAGMSFDYGVIPLPKYDEDQPTYVTGMRYQYNLFGISNGFDAETADMCSAVLEALASDSYRNLSPVIFEQTMKTRYSQDTTTSRMFDILRENICFDVGRIHGYSLTNFYPDFRSACFKGGGSWTATIKKYEVVLPKELGKLDALYRGE